MADMSSRGPKTAKGNGDEIDLAQLALLVWNHKLWICACTSAITILGIAYAVLATPVYHAYATITPKESGKGNDASKLFSQLGGMGGMVASQLGMGNTNLDKIEIILKGHDLAEAVIKRHNLMPILFRDEWDAGKSRWKPEDSLEVPRLQDGVKILREKVISVSVDAKKNILRFGANMDRPALAKEMAEHYLGELNGRIRANVIADADANREYLERQLSHTSDPILMEKIQNMIAFEIEKSMLISNQSFEILERPIVPMERSKPKKKFIVILSCIIGFMVSIAGIFVKSSFEGIKAAAGRTRD